MNVASVERPATAEELAVSADEERLLAAVRASVEEAWRKPHGRAARLGALAALRDDFEGAGEEDRPAVLAQLHEEASREGALGERALPDLEEPYFGHVRIRSGGRSRDVLIGARAFLDASRGVTIVDWRKAPIAEVFFTCEPGDDYEIEVDGRLVEGVLERRHVVAFDRGELAMIGVADGALVRREGAWSFAPSGLAPRLAGAREGEPSIGGSGPRVPMSLDRAQSEILERDPGEPLLVLGSAGSGKTTVALHRVAAICRRARVEPRRVLVVVPEPGLRRLSERLLGELAVEGAAVRTFDEWIRIEARRVFPWLPAHESPDTPFGVSRVKRHPAMFVAINQLIDALAIEAGERIDRYLGVHGEARAVLAERDEPILADRLARAEERLAEGATASRKRALAEAFRAERTALAKVRADHTRLVGDRALLEHAVRASGGDLPKALVEEIATYTGRQLDERAEVRYAHVRADRLVTLDGRSLDDGTPEAVAGTVDVEDYALLFEILGRKTGHDGAASGPEPRPGRAGTKKRGRRGAELTRYAHVVLDEAQELAPIELRVLGRAIDPEGGSVTVAGDAAQRIDRSSHFASWDGVMEALGVRATAAHLDTSYRCPEPIVDLAHAILGPDAPAEKPRAARGGAPVVSTVVPTEGHAALAIVAALRDLRSRDPSASIAVIARDADAARAVHDVVARALPARLVRDGEFSFGPGIEITEVAEVKGLEFDIVVVPDASATHYPSTPQHRRALHVAVTRAARQVWIVSPGVPTPIAPLHDGAASGPKPRAGEARAIVRTG